MGKASFARVGGDRTSHLAHLRSVMAAKDLFHHMERLEHYRQCIRKLLTEHATLFDSNSDIECQLIFDVDRDYYQLLDVGWEGLKRVYNCFLHFDIKDGKIWIQRHMTDVDMARELVEMGVAKQDIVLGLHPPYKRPYTGYGVA